jgi:hypothetical protein
MIMRKVNLICFFLYSVICINAAVKTASEQSGKSLSFIMNSGSLPKGANGKPYQDPQFLLSEGYNAMVTANLSTAITYDSFEKNLVKKGSAERKWIDSAYVSIKGQTTKLKSSGIELYSNIDFLVFPQSVWFKYGKQIQGTNPEDKHEGSFNGSKQKPDIQQPITQKLLVNQIDGIFKAFPEVDGIISRFGETYLHSMPFHRGNSPIKYTGYNTEIQDQITMLRIMREEICVKRNKKLIFRTWSFGNGFHNNLKYYLDVTNAIEPHPNLIFSIKYPQNDFLRMSAFNPTLGQGKHQQIVEAQSAMEAYGKGSHPYYTACGVINGFPETRYEVDNWKSKISEKLVPISTKRGIKDLLNSGLLKGVWTWSSGGGWQGPYLKSTVWNDLNSYVMSHWAQNTSKTEEELCYEYANKLGLEGFNADIFRKIAVVSTEAVRKGQCSDYTRNNLWWARDNFFSASYNKEIVKDIIKDSIINRVLAEKAEAVAMWLQIEQLSKQFQLKDKQLEEILQVSCSYGRIKYQLTEQMWYLMIQSELKNQSKAVDKNGIKLSIARYDALWSEWRELAKSPYCASLYKDLQFYDERKGSIGELVDQMR